MLTSLISLLLATTVHCCFHQLNVSFQTPLTSDTGLPIVQLNDPNVSTKLASALQEWGFSYVSEHGVPDEVIDEAQKESKKFFDLPMRVKRSIRAERFGTTKTSRGYTGMKLEQLNARGKPDLKEVLDVGHVSRGASKRAQHYLGNNKWLSRSRRSTLQKSTETFAEHASRVAQKILNLAAEGLGCRGTFDLVFGPDSLQVQRLTRYPPRHELNKTEPGEIGAGIHSDYGGITVLYAEGPGLSVLKPNRSSLSTESGTFAPELSVPNSEQWFDVDARPGSFIVMAGEALQRLSNGHIYAAKHKVDYHGSQPRYSLAFFYDPQPEAVLEPLACFKKNGKARYHPKMAGHKGVIKNAFKL